MGIPPRVTRKRETLPTDPADLKRLLLLSRRHQRELRAIVKAQRAALWRVAQALGMTTPLPNRPDVVDVVVRYAQETREALDAFTRSTGGKDTP